MIGSCVERFYLQVLLMVFKVMVIALNKPCPFYIGLMIYSIKIYGIFLRK